MHLKYLVMLLPSVAQAAVITLPQSKIFKLRASFSDDRPSLNNLNINAGGGYLWIGRPAVGGDCQLNDIKCAFESHSDGPTGFSIDNDRKVTLFSKSTQQVILNPKGRLLYTRSASKQPDFTVANILASNNTLDPFTLFQTLPTGIGGAVACGAAVNISNFLACPVTPDTTTYYMLMANLVTQSPPAGCTTIEVNWTLFDGEQVEQYV